MTLGFAAGPLVAGALAQWAPLSTILPYLPQLAGAGAALVLAARTPETVRSGTTAAGDSCWWRLRIRIPGFAASGRSASSRLRLACEI